MDKDGNAGAGRAVERKAEEIARQHREDDARDAFAALDPDQGGTYTQPGAHEEAWTAEEEEEVDEDEGDELDEMEDEGDETDQMEDEGDELDEMEDEGDETDEMEDEGEGPVPV